MKPKLYVENIAITALGIAHATHHLFSGPSIRTANPQKSGSQQPVSPYPGISLCSGSELLDSGFENAEILRGRED
jgi:hypothetical protein